MKLAYYIKYTTFTLLLSNGVSAIAQVTPENRGIKVPSAESPAERTSRSINESFKRFRPKRPRCISGFYNKPFPEDVEKIYADLNMTVFAYPDNYECKTYNEKTFCLVNEDSRYFIRNGDLSMRLRVHGPGQLMVQFGVASTYECKKLPGGITSLP